MTHVDSGKKEPYPTIPTDWNKLALFSTRCPCGKIHSKEIKQFLIRNGAIGDILEYIAGLFHGKSIGMVADGRTYSIAGQSVAEKLRSYG